MFDRWRKTSPIQFYTACFVITCHLFFFMNLFITKKETVSKIRPQRIVVKTKNNNRTPLHSNVQTVAQRKSPSPAAVSKVIPKQSPKPPKPPIEPKSKTVVQAKPSSPSKESVAKKNISSPTQIIKKNPSASKSRKPHSAKENSPISEELVQQLQESIAKIEKKPDKYRGEETFVLPEKLAPATTIANSDSYSENAQDYILGVKEELMQQLHMALHLPDYGEVKVQLQLNENGNVLSVKVLKAASQKNREYLEKELPRLSFSCIALHKLPAKERTFVISFHNEM